MVLEESEHSPVSVHVPYFSFSQFVSSFSLLLSLINPFQNNDIEKEDAIAYNLMGFKELLSNNGEKKSIKLLEDHGRKIFN